MTGWEFGFDSMLLICIGIKFSFERSRDELSKNWHLRCHWLASGSFWWFFERITRWNREKKNLSFCLFFALFEVWDCSHCDFWWSFEAVLAWAMLPTRWVGGFLWVAFLFTRQQLLGWSWGVISRYGMCGMINFICLYIHAIKKIGFWRFK